MGWGCGVWLTCLYSLAMPLRYHLGLSKQKPSSYVTKIAAATGTGARSRRGTGMTVGGGGGRRQMGDEQRCGSEKQSTAQTQMCYSSVRSGIPN